jgi:hypothetical protein
MQPLVLVEPAEDITWEERHVQTLDAVGPAVRRAIRGQKALKISLAQRLLYRTLVTRLD